MGLDEREEGMWKNEVMKLGNRMTRLLTSKKKKNTHVTKMNGCKLLMHTDNVVVKVCVGPLVFFFFSASFLRSHPHKTQKPPDRYSKGRGKGDGLLSYDTGYY